MKGDTTQGVFVGAGWRQQRHGHRDANDTRRRNLRWRLYVSQDSTQPSGTSNIASFGLLPTRPPPPTILSGISQTDHADRRRGQQPQRLGGRHEVDLSPEHFFFANATTLYVADGGQPKEGTIGDGGLQKWILNTTTGVWQLAYTLSAGLNLIENAA